MPYIAETRSLNFAFSRDKMILEDLSLQVPGGSIYGFLGPNGAGKTTTLRLLLGLIRSSETSIDIFGQSLKRNRLSLLGRIGSLIEQPSLYLHLSARENLRIFGIPYGVSGNRIDEVLEVVALANVKGQKTRAFSLGMKQRLAIAIALLHDPELLILDEPTNGLDPSGIVEVRDLVIKLNRELGKSIIISSHLLGEVEKIATHVGIIHKGKMLFQGTLTGLQQMRTVHTRIELETDNISKTVTVIGSRWPHRQIDEHAIQVETSDRESVASLNELMVENGIKVYRISPVRSDLEDLFMQIISE